MKLIVHSDNFLLTFKWQHQSLIRTEKSRREKRAKIISADTKSAPNLALCSPIAFLIQQILLLWPKGLG